MFKYSIDEFIAGKQKEKALTLLQGLLEKSYLVPFPELDELFDKHVRNYDFLEELHKLSARYNENIVMPIIPRESVLYYAQQDLQVGYDKFDKSWNERIPYVELSLPEGKTGRHGYDFQHVYICFFTKYDFQGTCDCVMHYFLKLNNLKAFL